MDDVFDIHGKALAVGDQVYYARKRNGVGKGQLLMETITKIDAKGAVWMGSYKATTPHSQIAKRG